MTKSIALLTRRAGLTRPQFHEYYETRHAPLAIGYFAFSKYVRNHLVGADEVEFDTLSEFWSEDIVRLAGLMQTEIGDIMRADEARFMDRAQNRSGASSESLLAGAPRGVESAPQSKVAWLLCRTAFDAVTFARAVADWGCACAARSGVSCERVTLDIVEPWAGPPFPFDAILWFWMRGGERPAESAAPDGVSRWRTIAAQSRETSPEAMAAALRAAARNS